MSFKVHIKQWHIVGNWTWDAGDDVCGICRNPFDGCPPDGKYPGDDSPVVWGVCGHALHLQCITKWLQQNQNQEQKCPLCRGVRMPNKKPCRRHSSSTLHVQTRICKCLFAGQVYIGEPASRCGCAAACSDLDGLNVCTFSILRQCVQAWEFKSLEEGNGAHAGQAPAAE
jgi:anaphase-promoting complex subunit 11